MGRGRGSVQLCSEPWDSAVAPADECGLPCSAFLSAFIPQALLNLSVVLIPSLFLFVLTLGLLSCGSSVATDPQTILTALAVSFVPFAGAGEYPDGAKESFCK